MRVLLVNAFHWPKGGVERTYLDESRWLAAAGHEVAHFATRDARNLPSPTAAYFAPGADWSEAGDPLEQLAHLPRALWSGPAARALRVLLAAFRPDVAHVHAPSRYLTPSVLRVLERARVPVVYTLHDFKPWCTNRLLFARGAVCERCRGGAHWHAATVGCVQDSHAKSVVAAAEAYLHDALGAYRNVRLWIAQSAFARDKAASLGADAARIRLLPHGVEPEPGEPRPADAPGRYALFMGRLSAEKGVRALPAIAARIAPVPLLVAGGGPMEGWLAARSGPRMRLLGHRTGAPLRALREHAACVLSPSLFPETFGYSVAEALLDARPVVATRVGALPELVEHEVTGLVAAPGDDAGFAALAARALDDPAAARWGEAGRERVRRMTDPAAHVAGLVALYEEARTAS